MTGPALDAAVAAALADVYDPCSVAAGRPRSLPDMGLVLGATLVPDGTLTVRYAVTFGGCTMAPHFTAAAAERLATLPGVVRVESIVDTSFQWTTSRLRGAAPAMRGTPQAWRTRT